MHPALAIDEILLNIFCYRCLDTANLSALARTCRVFKEPALNVLWQELDTLSPLGRCLPGALHPGIGVSLSRSLTQTEWAVLRSYTHRIRSIRNFHSGLDLKSFRILSNPPTTEPLFPSLHHLHCVYTIEAMPLLHLPLPNLKSVDVEFSNDLAFLNHLQSFPRFSQNLQEFSIHMRWGGFNKIDSDYICRWRNLRSVVCPDFFLYRDTLVQLSCISTLTRLAFTLSTTLLDQFLPSELPLHFSNLCDLELHSASLGAISRLLSRIQAPFIKIFTALINNCPSGQDTHFFFTSIQTSFAGHAVQKLRLLQSVLLSQPREHSERKMLSFQDLQPSMMFGDLRHIELNVACLVDLRDSGLLTLALAWPHLEYLSINAKWGWNTRGGITPNGLVQLLQTCWSLNQISLALDTQGYTEVLESPANLGLTLPRALSIDVLDSFIDATAVPAVVAFFVDFTPCTKLSLLAWQRTLMLGPQTMQECKRHWDYVQRQVHNKSF